MSSTPLGARSLKIKIGTAEYAADINDCQLISGPADSAFTSFAAAAAGGARKYTLKFTATQDPADSTSIWRKVWTSAGSTAAVSINPYGGAAFSATNPGYQGNVVITEPDGNMLGGAANSDPSARFTIELEWVFAAKPLEITTGTY
jgi:hypothetical protein